MGACPLWHGAGDPPLGEHGAGLRGGPPLSGSRCRGSGSTGPGVSSGRSDRAERGSGLTLLSLFVLRHQAPGAPFPGAGKRRAMAIGVMGRAGGSRMGERGSDNIDILLPLTSRSSTAFPFYAGLA